MHIKQTTRVNAPLEKVKQNFGKELFLKLNPPFPPVKLIKFEGNQPGNQVALVLNFFLFKQTWISEIIQASEDKYNFLFEDEGKKLPFFLTYWHHRHQLKSKGSGTLITDDIYFRTPIWLPAILIWPVLYLQFLYRKPIYKKFFAS